MIERDEEGLQVLLHVQDLHVHEVLVHVEAAIVLMAIDLLHKSIDKHADVIGFFLNNFFVKIFFKFKGDDYVSVEERLRQNRKARLVRLRFYFLF